MKLKQLLLVCASCLLLLPAAAAAQTIEYSYAQISLANSTVDLIPSTSATGSLMGIKCNFAADTDVKLEFTIDGNASSFIIDPTYFGREASGAGQYLSGWIPFNTGFNTSIHVQLNNSTLGTSTINCWASWVEY
jgi:hypothetical protein